MEPGGWEDYWEVDPDSSFEACRFKSGVILFVVPWLIWKPGILTCKVVEVLGSIPGGATHV